MDKTHINNESMNPWSQFIDFCTNQAKQFECFDQLIHNLQESIQALSPSDKIIAQRFAELEKNADGPYNTDVCVDDPFCKIMLILLQPNAQIGLHNHPKQSGLIFCHQGAVHVDAYNEISAHPPMATLQKVYSKTIQKGECASLTPTNANIHSLKTNQLTMLIDIFIPPHKEENREHSRSYTITGNIPNTNFVEATIH